MSRFDQGRWGRILVWTGAALAWGSALTALHLHPARAEGPTNPADTTQTQIATVEPAMPAAPAQGLVVIRYRQSVATEPEVNAVPPSPIAEAQAVVPAPVSSGS